MIFAEFYNRDLSGNVAQATGDRSVIVLDGRERDQRWHAIAADEAKKRGYVAYMIRRGDTFTRSQALSKIINVESRTDLQTVSARINSGA